MVKEPTPLKGKQDEKKPDPSPGDKKNPKAATGVSASEPAAWSVKPETVEGKNGSLESRAAVPVKGRTPGDKVVEKAGTEPLAAASAPTASAKTIVPEPEPPSEVPMPAQTAEAKREKADERRSTTEKPAPESVDPSPLKTPASARTGGRGEKEPGPGRAFPTEAEFMTDLPPLPTGEATDEAQEAELLQTVEEQFKDLPPMEEPAPALFWETVEVVEAEPAPKPQPDTSPPDHVIPCMRIVQITPELAPVAKVGGLADVVFGLSRELEIRANHVEIILPKYDCLRYDHIWGLCETYRDLWVPWYGGAIHCTVFFGSVHGRKCYFIEPHSADKFFNRGNIYGFNDDVMRFAFSPVRRCSFSGNPASTRRSSTAMIGRPRWFRCSYTTSINNWACGIQGVASPSIISSTRARPGRSCSMPPGFTVPSTIFTMTACVTITTAMRSI